jgi:AcrR family transcriptional regulator
LIEPKRRGRPQTISDGALLDAARRVILRRGYGNLTITEIAEESGLSRPGISLRFKDIETITTQLVERTFDDFAAKLAAIPASQCGEGLIALAEATGASIEAGASVSSLILALLGHRQDGRWAALPRRHRDLLRAAIAARMPKTTLPHDEAVAAFTAHLMAHVFYIEVGIDRPACPRAFLVHHTKQWLALAQIQASPTR